MPNIPSDPPLLRRSPSPAPEVSIFSALTVRLPVKVEIPVESIRSLSVPAVSIANVPASGNPNFVVKSPACLI